MKITESSVTIKDLRVHARHGVDEQERTVGNDFLVTAQLFFNADGAMKFDDVNLTVNYAEVVRIICDVMREPSRLLENVVWRLINAITEAFPVVTSGTITVIKEHPPVSAQMTGASFSASFRN